MGILIKSASSLIIDVCSYFLVLNSVFRPHRSTAYVDAAYCYRRSSVVPLSVCRSVSQSVTIVNPAKTAEPMEMPFGVWT